MSNRYDTTSNPFELDYNDHKGGHVGRRDGELSHEEQIQRMMQEIDDSEARQLDSTRRALASIDESERTGIATAEVMSPV